MRVVFKIEGSEEVVSYENIDYITMSELISTKELLEYESKLPIEMTIEN